jgi:hypothetical protein
VQTPDDVALDALATALAPRVLEKVRALLAAEQDDDRALGVAGLAELGYVPGPCPESLSATQRRAQGQHAARAKKR